MSRLYDVFSFLYVFIFVMNRAGKQYGVSRWKKLRLAVKILRNHSKISALTTWQQHLLLVEEILKVPADVRGDVVECGCFNGSSSVVLSLACGLIGRRLFVCDSFEGLPPPKEDEKHTYHSATAESYDWQEGEFSSQGGIGTVRNNITKYGNIEACTFVKGFFEDTLKDIETDAVVLVFEDADLVSSVEDCLKYLWPKLQDNCLFFCHEPWSIDVVGIFYNQDWWQKNLNTTPPGFYGSGQGVVVKSRYYRAIGYTRKFDPEKARQEGKRRVHAGSMGFGE